jgi:hypothetical protein
MCLDSEPTCSLSLAGTRMTIAQNSIEAGSLTDLFLALQHGRLQDTSVASKLCQLKRRQQHALLASLQQNSEPPILIELENQCEAIFQEFAPLAKTVVQYKLFRHLSEEVDQRTLAQRLSVLAGTDSADEILHRIGEFITNHNKPIPEVRKSLSGIESSYSHEIADVVSQVALNPPSKILDGISTKSGETQALVERFKKIEQGVEQDMRDLDTSDLERSIYEYLGEKDAKSRDNNDFYPTVPLLTKPRELDYYSHTPLQIERLESRFRGWFFYQAFTENQLGGVIYPHQSTTFTRLVNPWIASDELTKQEQTYSAHWNEALFYDYVIGQLFDRAQGNLELKKITCPLCYVSTARCGGDSCSYRPRIARINRSLHELVASLRRSPELDQVNDRTAPICK